VLEDPAFEIVGNAGIELLERLPMMYT